MKRDRVARTAALVSAVMMVFGGLLGGCTYEAPPGPASLDEVGDDGGVGASSQALVGGDTATAEPATALEDRSECDCEEGGYSCSGSCGEGGVCRCHKRSGGCFVECEGGDDDNYELECSGPGGSVPADGETCSTTARCQPASTRCDGDDTATPTQADAVDAELQSVILR